MFSVKDPERPVVRMPGWDQFGECRTRVVFIAEYGKEEFNTDAEEGVIQAIEGYGKLVDRQVFYPEE